MKIARAILLLSLIALSGPGQASTVRELDAAELRRATQEGDLISLKSVIEAVAKSTGGQPLEVRAFEAGEFYYRMVLKTPNGEVVSVIINARTGEQIPKTSAVGRQVASAAEAGSKSKGKSQAAGANGKANGNGHGGGNGGGNGGGTGNNGDNGGGNGKGKN
jgi:hypothetical protein